MSSVFDDYTEEDYAALGRQAREERGRPLTPEEIAALRAEIADDEEAE
jgi:hypothetical protein